MRERIKDNMRLRHMREAINEIKSGKVVYCKTFEDYKNAVK